MTKAAIYTRTGDEGTTGLVGGTRLRKSDSRIHLYGEVDELNSHLGVGISQLSETFDKTFLHEIQSALFDLGSNLACEKEKRTNFKLPQLKEEMILRIEQEIDKMDSQLPRLNSFILPGGTMASSSFHVCRTVCRRVERQLVDFEDLHSGEVPDCAIRFMNRLSDYFFVFSRFLNFINKTEEIQWIPSKK